MKHSQDLIDLITEFEGCRLKSYRDQRGVWTCGFGATGPGITGNTNWTMAQAQARLSADLSNREKILNEYLAGVTTSQGQFDAMLSLAYNIGLGAFHTSDVYKLHMAGMFLQAAQAFMDYDHVRIHGVLTENRGLERRRAAERDLYLSDRPA